MLQHKNVLFTRAQSSYQRVKCCAFFYSLNSVSENFWLIYLRTSCWLRALERRMTLKMWIKHDRLRLHTNTKSCLFKAQRWSDTRTKTSLINGSTRARAFREFHFVSEFLCCDTVTWLVEKNHGFAGFFLSTVTKRCNWDLFEFYFNSEV